VPNCIHYSIMSSKSTFKYITTFQIKQMKTSHAISVFYVCHICHSAFYSGSRSCTGHLTSTRPATVAGRPDRFPCPVHSAHWLHERFITTLHWRFQDMPSSSSQPTANSNFDLLFWRSIYDNPKSTKPNLTLTLAFGMTLTANRLPC